MIRPLAEVFGEMSDPRDSSGQWHSLGTTLTVIFLAILSGENGLRGMAAWIGEQRWRLGPKLKLRNCRMPSYGTIRRVLGQIDVLELEQRLNDWAQTTLASMGGEAWEGIAIDGKTVKGSLHGEQAALHLLSAFSQQFGAVLSQRAVGAKTNEIPEARTLLEGLTLSGRVVTVDALHTNPQTAQAIVEKGGPTS